MLFVRNIAVLSSFLLAGTCLHAMDEPEDQTTTSQPQRMMVRSLPQIPQDQKPAI